MLLSQGEKIKKIILGVHISQGERKREIHRVLLVSEKGKGSFLGFIIVREKEI